MSWLIRRDQLPAEQSRGADLSSTEHRLVIGGSRTGAVGDGGARRRGEDLTPITTPGWDPSATREDLRRLAMWLTMESPELRVIVDRALDTVQAVARAEFWQTARASSEVHEEAPFALLERHNGLPTVLSGVVDLAYRVAEGWRIVDYKTDVDADPAELQQRYAKQIGTYRVAWSRIASAPVVAEIAVARQGRVR